MSGTRTRAVLYSTGLLLGMASPSSGQAPWTEMSTLGYGGLGVAAGVLASGDDLYLFDDRILVGALLGMFVGYRIGGGAEAYAREGLKPTGAQLFGVRLGTVAGGAAIGAGIAGLYIAFGEGNAQGEDERNLRLFSAVGGVLGLIVEALIERNLNAGLAPAGRRLMLEPGPAGTLRVGAVLRLRD